ncbi:hypothetical protein Cci01nite_79410 [Catellatospora citrea]|uniref:PH (Pleckstrin Homology) domain-containing protein n=1 Tax=Catellatospora citrea TaxID=53366 RepID=A0A8J3KMI3_9ACTN|nr:hypothetical protein Cci01nite_79410 [Catellatospora citrea]
MSAAPAIDELLADTALRARWLRAAAWSLGGVGLLVTISAGAIGGDAMWRPAVSTFTAIVVVVGYLVAARRLWRKGAQALLVPSGLPLGFTTVAGPRQHVMTTVALAASGVMLGQGAPARLGTLSLGVALAFLLLAVLLTLRPVRITITPVGLLVRRIRTRSVPWTHLTSVQVPAGVNDLLSMAVDRPGRMPVTLRIGLRVVDVDPAFLAHLVRHYLDVPEDRTAIGAPAELARRRAEFLAAENAEDAGAAAVPPQRERR